MVQMLRGDVRSVRPDQRVPGRVESELAESRNVPQRLKYRANQLRRQVDLSLRAIAKTHPYVIFPKPASLALNPGGLADNTERR